MLINVNCVLEMISESRLQQSNGGSISGTLKPILWSEMMRWGKIGDDFAA